MGAIRLRGQVIPALAAVALLCAAAPLACAQTFVEVGAGWNFVAPAPFGDFYGRGYDIRVSAGRRVAPRVALRLDFSLSEFAHDMQFYPPCLFPGCLHPYYYETQMGIAGLSANAVVNLDRRGLLYVTGGAGVFDRYDQPASVFGGVSFGAGLSVPIRGRLRAFVEADKHIFAGDISHPPWIVPLTFGVRIPHGLGAP
ncbi:MAG: hypothetical protein ACHQSE_12985 [Gemmatimonadales bacterium]